MKLFTLLLATFALLAKDPIIQTQNGPVQGFTKDNLQVFLGIPFAKPPVGDLRWKAPQALDRWEKPILCQKFSASPMQNEPAPFMYWSQEYLIPKEPISEDCLYLNVWTKKTPKPKAVLVYIYGGGFRSGGTACPIYDGANMAKEDIVFVSINYRVGVFGFLAHPELAKESPQNTSGNYGILDLIAGLKWVKQNIASFGGDPNQVTIAGQSAGATAVSILCASPLAKGLFQNAILESGALGLGFFNSTETSQNQARAEQASTPLFEKLGVSSIKQLREIPAKQIQKVNAGLSAPFSDNYVIPYNLKETYISGAQNDVNLIIGWNKDDRVGPKPLAANQYIEQIKLRYKEKANEILKYYPANSEEQAYQSQIELGRNESFGSKQYELARLQSIKGKSKIYMYRFDRNVPAHNKETDFGAFHTGEVVYAYNNLHTVDRPWTQADQELAHQMSSYWINFTKTSNPNSSNTLGWPEYKQSDKKVLHLDEKSEVRALQDAPQLEILNQ